MTINPKLFITRSLVNREELLLPEIARNAIRPVMDFRVADIDLNASEVFVDIRRGAEVSVTCERVVPFFCWQFVQPVPYQ